MLNWINEKIDGYAFDRLIKKDFHLDKADLIYMQKFKGEPKLLEILEKIATSCTITAVKTRTVDGLKNRDSWIKCISVIKSMILAEKIDPQVNPVTGEPIAGKK